MLEIFDILIKFAVGFFVGVLVGAALIIWLLKSTEVKE